MTAKAASAQTIGVFGLGSMGFGIASSILAGGFRVFGFDPNPDAVSNLIDSGGESGDPVSLAPGLDVAVIVVVNSSQTEDVLFGSDGIAPQLKSGSTVIACATVAPRFARDMEKRCNELGIHYLDAPISGGSIKAAAGQLSVMASGAEAAFDGCGPVLDAMAETVFRLGDSAGAGSAMKVVNQLLAGVHIAAAAEAITFGITQGIEPEDCVAVIAQCAGTSWMFENRGPHIAQGDYSPHSAVDIWLKDLGIVLDIARGEKFSAPLTAAALQQFIAASGSGLGREDDAAVAKVYARNAGITLPGVE
jgi:L-threonate 2-dehydrogenase